MKFRLITLFLLITIVGFSQPVKINFSAGFANYSGDIQQKAFTLQQAQSVFGIGVSYELSNKLLLRSDLLIGKVGASDKRNSSVGVQMRNLDFKSSIQELNLLAEYNLLNVSETNWSPYAFAGLGVFHFDPYTCDYLGYKVYLQPLATEGQGLAAYPDRKMYKRIQLNIPVGGGIKYAISEDVHLAVELGFRKLFTDYLDDVSTTQVDLNLLYDNYGPKSAELAYRGDELKPVVPHQLGGKRGNPGYKDYYYFGQLRLGIRLNWFESMGGAKNYGCPSRIW